MGLFAVAEKYLLSHSHTGGRNSCQGQRLLTRYLIILSQPPWSRRSGVGILHDLSDASSNSFPSIKPASPIPPFSLRLFYHSISLGKAVAYPCPYGYPCYGMNHTAAGGPRTLHQCPKQAFRTEPGTETQSDCQPCPPDHQCPGTGKLWIEGKTLDFVG